MIIVDFGTATTFDVINSDGAYVGGSILPGVEISAQALADRAAKLPAISLRIPDKAIGTTTIGSLESGIILGTASAIDGLAAKIVEEMDGQPRIIATGGLGAVFAQACKSIELYDSNLTLDGLKICWERTRA